MGGQGLGPHMPETPRLASLYLEASAKVRLCSGHMRPRLLFPDSGVRCYELWTRKGQALQGGGGAVGTSWGRRKVRRDQQLRGREGGAQARVCVATEPASTCVPAPPPSSTPAPESQSELGGQGCVLGWGGSKGPHAISLHLIWS